jgi:hypothetical protein
MEPTTHRRLTAAEGRKFAFTLAFGFGAIAALVWWRGNESVSGLFAGVAVVAFLAGLVAPTHLGPISRAWAAFGAALSRVTSPVFFTLIYMVVVAPIGLVRRTFGKSPLARDRDASSFWIRRQAPDAAVQRASLERQF